MPSAFQTIVAVAAMVIPVIGGDCFAAAAAPSKTIVLEGTVTSIRQIDHELTPWLITVKVEKVVSGEFSGPLFRFAVHSPSRAGLEKGRSYTIEAVETGGGYVVDETQWRRGKRVQAGIGASTLPNRGSTAKAACLVSGAAGAPGDRR